MIFKKIEQFYKSKYFGLSMIVIAIISALLILFIDSSSTASIDKMNDENEYTEILEQRINKIVSKIEGAGKTFSMISLENTYESVYAKEFEKELSSKTTTGENTDNNSAENYREKIEKLEKDSGEQAIEITKILPKISGVIIVCEGGDIPLVKSEIKTAISTVLGINEIDVCVLKSR